MAALLRAWHLPAVRCQPLGQLGRRLLHHDHRAPGHARVTSAARVASPAVFKLPSRSVAAAAGGGVATRGTEKVNEGFLEYYDDLISAWEKLLGTHIHQGFYDPGATTTPADHHSAVLRMMEEAVSFAGISDDPAKRPKRILDVGCGIGAGTIYLSKRLGTRCDGINISPPQIERCRSLAATEGVTDRVTFHLGDAMDQPFPDGQFDLVWCMEVAEHLADKKKFFNELVRVAAPGGTIVITSMCQRDTEAEPLTPDEEVTLNRVCESLHLRSWYSVSGYVKMAESLALEDIKTADWSENILPLWPAIMRFATTLEGSTMLLQSGRSLINGEGINRSIAATSIDRAFFSLAYQSSF